MFMQLWVLFCSLADFALCLNDGSLWVICRTGVAASCCVRDRGERLQPSAEAGADCAGGHRGVPLCAFGPQHQRHCAAADRVGHVEQEPAGGPPCAAGVWSLRAILCRWLRLLGGCWGGADVERLDAVHAQSEGSPFPTSWHRNAAAYACVSLLETSAPGSRTLACDVNVREQAPSRSTACPFIDDAISRALTHAHVSVPRGAAVRRRRARGQRVHVCRPAPSQCLGQHSAGGPG